MGLAAPLETAEPTASPRWPAFDFLRVVSALAVVWLHVTASFLAPYADTASWRLAVGFSAVSRFAVPMFVMLSGALVLSKEHLDLPRHYRNAALRLLWPVVFWAGTYVYLNRVFGFLPDRPLVASVFVGQGPGYHLWFLWMLLGVYAVLPFLWAMVRGLSRAGVWLFVGVWAALNLLNGHLAYWGLPPLPLVEELVTHWAGYVVLGWLLTKHVARHSPTRLQMVLWFGLFVVCAWATAWLTRWQSAATGKMVEFFWGSTSFSVLGMCVALFFCIHGVSFGLRSRRWLEVLAACSYGVYLVHIAVLWVMERYGQPVLARFGSSLFLVIPAKTMLCYLLSLSLVWSIRRIPVVRSIVP